jgi:uncharacterized SAM-binding protein YcdF (DUF218 family)
MRRTITLRQCCRSEGCGAVRNGVAGRRRRPFSGWRRTLVVALAIIVAFSLATARLFVWPAQGVPAHVNAIVMLGGSGDRLAAALKLVQEHRASILVVSQGRKGYGGPCPPPTPGVNTICFNPSPSDTRGEVEFVSRLAQRYHWRSLALVTTRLQDTRARILMERCFGGSIYVSTASLPLTSWPFTIAYEWGALFKALALYRAC